MQILSSNYDLKNPATGTANEEHRVLDCGFDSDEEDIPGETMSQAALYSNYDLKNPETGTANEERVSHHVGESNADPRLLSDVSIFRVPNFLKQLNEKAYVPQIVSLGPYHFGKENLRGMNASKKSAVHRMMARVTHSHKMVLSAFLDHSDMDKIQKSYAEKNDMDKIKKSYAERNGSKEKIIFIMDGCFILEILRTLGGDKLIRDGSDKYEPIFDRNRINFTGFDILNDILKLENQIPFIVLRKLLQVEFESVYTAEKYLFDVLVKTPGRKLYPFDYEMTEWSPPPPDEQVDHLLGLLHSLIVSPPSDERAILIDNNGEEKSGKDDRCIPRAVELSNAGIKFERCNGGIKQICFNRKTATIYLPPIIITEHTEVLFRNLIALELCNAYGDNYVSSYLSLMNNLIDTEKDVVVLTKSKIVINYLGSDAEVAELFNGLTKGVTLPRKNVFNKQQNDVMEHYNDKWKVLIAQFVKEHFSPPWKFVALLGAISALLLTLVQTIFTVLSYFK